MLFNFGKTPQRLSTLATLGRFCTPRVHLGRIIFMMGIFLLLGSLSCTSTPTIKSGEPASDAAKKQKDENAAEAALDVPDKSEAAAGSSKQKSEEKVDANLSDEDKKKIDDMTAEMEVGRGMAGRLLQFYGVVDNERLLKYVNTLSRYVGTYSEAPDRRYMVALLDTEQVNAFACPGGYILLTMGALRLAQNEAELAMVLGHEVAHVGKRHMYNTLKSMSKEDMDKASEEMEAKLKLAPEVRVRERVRPDDSAIANLFARYLAGGAGAGFSILKAAKAGMSVILEKGLDQKYEFEADHEGVRYAIHAGYDPKGLEAFLNRILATTPIEKRKVLNSTHPPIDQRVAKIEELLKQLEADKIVGALGRKRFAKYAELFPPVKKK